MAIYFILEVWERFEYVRTCICGQKESRVIRSNNPSPEVNKILPTHISLFYSLVVFLGGLSYPLPRLLLSSVKTYCMLHTNDSTWRAIWAGSIRYFVILLSFPNIVTQLRTIKTNFSCFHSKGHKNIL